MQSLQSLVIPYVDNTSTDSQLWDGNFCPISIFGMDKYLEDDARNIICLLHRIVMFIKQHKLKDRTAEDILQIS